MVPRTDEDAGEADDARIEVIGRIHDAPAMAVVAVTGGGGGAVADLLNVPGASRTILEVRVPYAPAALAELLGGVPAQAASAATAAALSGACRDRARHLAAPNDTAAAGVPLLGVACSAALASDRPKRGEHRAHVALTDGHGTRVWSLTLAKGTRDRAGEDRLVSDLVLAVLAVGCGLGEALRLAVREGDRLESPAG